MLLCVCHELDFCNWLHIQLLQTTNAHSYTMKRNELNELTDCKYNLVNKRLSPLWVPYIPDMHTSMKTSCDASCLLFCITRNRSLTVPTCSWDIFVSLPNWWDHDVIFQIVYQLLRNLTRCKYIILSINKSLAIIYIPSSNFSNVHCPSICMDSFNIFGFTFYEINKWNQVRQLWLIQNPMR